MRVSKARPKGDGASHLAIPLRTGPEQNPLRPMMALACPLLVIEEDQRRVGVTGVLRDDADIVG